MSQVMQNLLCYSDNVFFITKKMSGIEGKVLEKETGDVGLSTCFIRLNITTYKPTNF